MRRPTAIMRVLLAAGMAGTATACTAVLPAGTVSAGISSQLQGQGVPAEDVSCGEDLAAVQNAVVRCSFRVEGQLVTAVATVISVDGGSARYRIDTEAQPIDQQLLEQQIRDDIDGRIATPVKTVACTGPLPAKIDSAVACTVDDDWVVLARVTALEGGRVTFAVQEASSNSGS